MVNLTTYELKLIAGKRGIKKTTKICQERININEVIREKFQAFLFFYFFFFMKRLYTQKCT